MTVSVYGTIYKSISAFRKNLKAIMKKQYGIE